MFKVYVILFNEYGMELSREKFEDMDKARHYVMTEVIFSCDVGDTIKFEEID